MCEALVHDESVQVGTSCIMKNLVLYNKKFGLFLVGKREPMSRLVF